MKILFDSRLRRCVPVLASLLLTAATAQADGSANDWVQRSAGVNKASNATFDDRLPPVIPGEELKDGRATTKVWSTGGQLSTSEVPQPGSSPCANQNCAPGYDTSGVGVVIDGRGVLPRPPRVDR